MIHIHNPTTEECNALTGKKVYLRGPWLYEGILEKFKG